jgi:hypothetical protein
MSLKCCRIDKVLCFPFWREKERNYRNMQTSRGTATHIYTRARVTFSFSTSSHNPPFCTPFPQCNYLPRPPIPTRLSSANTSPPLHPTAHNHGYYAGAEYTSAAILSTALCARSPENDKKVKRSKIVGPYIPYGIFQTNREMCAKPGSEM